MIKNSQSFFLEAKKSLGQNFLKSQAVIDKIVQSISNSLSQDHSTQLVHEIGPGTGAITRPMLEKGLNILGLEKDVRAFQGLKETLGVEYPKQISFLEQDILRFDPALHVENQKPLCFGNIPYYITSDIMLWFCKNKHFYTHGIFMVQNEVADRLQASYGTKEYGRLSVKMQLHFEVEKLFVVPAASFVPKPKVDSAIIKLTPKEFIFSPAEKEKAFESFCALLFSARRKMLRRVLTTQLHELTDAQKQQFWETCATFHVREDTRPDAISPTSILSLYFLVAQLGKVT